MVAGHCDTRNLAWHGRPDMTGRPLLLTITAICAVLLGDPFQPSASAWNEEDFERKPSRSYVLSEGDDVIGQLRGHRVR